jgi:hypothetical protein
VPGSVDRALRRKLDSANGTDQCSQREPVREEMTVIIFAFAARAGSPCAHIQIDASFPLGVSARFNNFFQSCGCEPAVPCFQLGFIEGRKQQPTECLEN